MQSLKPAPAALFALLTLFVAGCGGQATTSEARATEATAPPAAAVTQPAAATAPRAADPFAASTTNAQEKAVLAWLERNMADKANASMFDAAIGHAIERVEACQTAECRATAIADRRAIVTFAAGKSARVAGLPFASGDFSRAEQGYSGVARIVPLGNEAALLVVNLSFKGRPVCSLDGTMTKASDGSFDVSSLGEKLPALRLVPEGTNSFTLSYADPNHQPYQVDYCSIGTSINGTYRSTLNRRNGQLQ